MSKIHIPSSYGFKKLAKKVKLKTKDVSTNNEDTNRNNSMLVFMRSKYKNLLNEYANYI